MILGIICSFSSDLRKAYILPHNYSLNCLCTFYSNMELVPFQNTYKECNYEALRSHVQIWCPTSSDLYYENNIIWENRLWMCLSLICIGVMWPLEGMPTILRYFSYTLPVTYPAEAMRAIMGRGKCVKWYLLVCKYQYRINPCQADQLYPTNSAIWLVRRD